MNVTIELNGQLKQQIGRSSLHYQLNDGASLSDLIATMKNDHQSAVERFLVNEDGSIKPSMMLFINDEQRNAQANHELKDGDTVGFISPISGG